MAKGDRVTPGQVLGLTGSSGNSSEPHIHFHVQDSPNVGTGTPVGIPVRFRHHLADGAHQDRRTPSAGQFITPTAPKSEGG